MKKTLKNTTSLSTNKANDELTKLGNDIVTLDNAIDKKIGQVDGKMYDFSIEYAVRINSQYPNGASKKEVTAFNKLVCPETMKSDTRKKLSAMGNNNDLLALETETRNAVGEGYKSSDLKDVLGKKVDSDGKKTADTFRKMQKAFQNAEKLAESRDADISAGGDDAKNMRDGLHWLLSLSNDDIQNIFLTHRELKICTDNDKAFASMEAREKAFDAIDRMIINIIKQNNKNAS
tara:strand:- start:411 stop:1109 length:699 start_codon:yes stop_codon:yes gene_type:complete